MVLLSSVVIPLNGREPDATLTLWPGEAPGETRVQSEERILENRPRPFYQLTDISQPELKIFHAPQSIRNGTAVLVCPGGGLQRLAYEHEGLEVAEWLNSIGVSAFVLKYRVPAPARTGLMDTQRAMGLIRQNAQQWSVDPESIGILGFSAGGELALWLSTHFEERTYEPVDAADRLACKPAFAGLIYPGGLLRWRSGELKTEFAERIGPQMPPLFLVHAFDDSSQNSLQLMAALKEADVPAELHLFQNGGHGFGVRPSGLPVDDWTNRFTEWLGYQGFMDPPSARLFARSFLTAIHSGAIPPIFSEAHPNATLPDAYAAQRRLVRALAGERSIGGFKGAGASAAAQSALGIDGPMTGVLFADGRLNADSKVVIERPENAALAVETEIGYSVSVDIAYEILSDQQMKEAVSAVFPVIELPKNLHPDGGAPNARNMVAENIGSDRFIVGREFKPGEVDPNQWDITLHHNGELLHTTNGGSANGGQWHNLRSILNHITSQGYTIRSGSLIICGALGGVHDGKPGQYEARFGDDAVIEFEIR